MAHNTQQPMLNSIQHRIWRWTKSEYLLGLGLVFLVLVVRFFRPQLINNEAVYLPPIRQLIDPSFLANDWSLGASAGPNLALLFSALFAPLWLLVGNPLAVALLGRMLSWGFLLYAFGRLGREMGIGWRSFTIGLGLWIGSWQSMGAGEWIFGGVEQKCPAYAFLLLALTEVLRQRELRAGVFTGMAVAFHVLVGGWGGMALGGALVLSLRSVGWRRIARFGASAALIGSPALLLAIWHTAQGTVGGVGGESVDQLLVVFRNPHHLDPYFFLRPDHGRFRIVRILLIALGTFFSVRELLPRARARLVLSFLATLLAVFAAGVVARGLGMFWFLKYYPFRVADVILPAIFWIAFPGLLARRIREFAKRATPPTGGLAVRGAVTGLYLMFLIWSAGHTAANLGTDIPELARSWRESSAEPSAFGSMTQWIRDKTETSAIFIAPPWEATFWLEAERAMVVQFKITPANYRALEWRERMERLNGDRAFGDAVGWRIIQEQMMQYPHLTPSLLRSIRAAYRADYYLVPKRRSDLEPALVHATGQSGERGGFYLYDLRKL